MEIGNEQLVRDVLSYLRRDAVTLITHDDDSLIGQLVLINIVPVQQGSVDRIGGREGFEKFQQIRVNDPDVCKTAHGRLHHLRVIDIRRVQ